MDTTSTPLVLFRPIQCDLVLRFWGEPTMQGAWAWRASVTHLESREKRFFSRPDELETYFRSLGLGWPEA